MTGVVLDSEDNLVFYVSGVNILNKIRQNHKGCMGKCFGFFLVLSISYMCVILSMSPLI